MTEYRDTPDTPSGWSVAGITFAGTILIVLGIFQAIEGLAAIFDDQFYVVTQNYAFDLDVTAWGWVHLVLGVILVLVGFALLGGSAWAGVAAIVLAVLSAISNFFFIPYYPFWSLLMIGLAIWIIWAITRPGALRA